MELGSVVKAIVDQVEQYGVFLVHGVSRIFIQIPELDWESKISDPRGFTKEGEEFDVFIVAYNDQKNLYYGSIKRAYPELDPWFDRLKYEVGTKHKGTVVMNTDYGSFVKIVSGVEALAYDEYDGKLVVGTSIEVKVVGCDPEKRQLKVEIIT